MVSYLTSDCKVEVPIPCQAEAAFLIRIEVVLSLPFTEETREEIVSLKF